MQDKTLRKLKRRAGLQQRHVLGGLPRLVEDTRKVLGQFHQEQMLALAALTARVAILEEKSERGMGGGVI
jgi:hypothetical protein